MSVLQLGSVCLYISFAYNVEKYYYCLWIFLHRMKLQSTWDFNVKIERFQRSDMIIQHIKNSTPTVLYFFRILLINYKQSKKESLQNYEAFILNDNQRSHFAAAEIMPLQYSVYITTEMVVAAANLSDFHVYIENTPLLLTSSHLKN